MLVCFLLVPVLWHGTKPRVTLSAPPSSLSVTSRKRKQNLALGVYTGAEIGLVGCSYTHLQLLLAKTTARRLQTSRRSATLDFLPLKRAPLPREIALPLGDPGCAAHAPLSLLPGSVKISMAPLRFPCLHTPFPKFSLGLNLGACSGLWCCRRAGEPSSAVNNLAQRPCTTPSQGLITYHR